MGFPFENNRCFKVTKPQFRHREKENYRYLPATVSRPSGAMRTNTTTDTKTFAEKTGTPTKSIDKKATESQISLQTRD
ncbi:hypothetical protein H2200_010976 [Cladophialophora chaetospira]|uniref:Uncharacterized protein n=1 Tax=Cladophialophora chaetospira TaxID=386627 RepID=A0AA38X136_9EURO|nr:hypothetical protein H2200_010976 [Cladophialophora chaetospira]